MLMASSEWTATAGISSSWHARMTRSAISPRLATSTFLNMSHLPSLGAPRNPASWYPRSPPRALPSSPRGCYGRGGGARHERGERHLYEIKRYERQDALRQGGSEGQLRNHGEPGCPESVDDRKTRASPDEAGP